MNLEVAYNRARAEFESKRQDDSSVRVSSPGRINIIGDHTDYHGGFVLPAAVDFRIELLIKKTKTDLSTVYSLNYKEKCVIENGKVTEGDHKWVQFFLGGLSLLRIPQNVDIVFGGDIPLGAGMSSSAALSCGLLMGLSELFSLNLSRKEIAMTAQQIEHQFVGVNCGLMDQMACVMGQESKAILLNCDSLEFDRVGFDLKEYEFLLLNSNVDHSLESSGYNDRRSESESVIDKINSRDKFITSYNDLTPAVLNSYQGILTDVELKRAKHVISENTRTIQAHDAMQDGDWKKVGNLITDSHRSLQNDYEVTCEETDFLVDQLTSFQDVLGARQMGGGFGGCVIALVHRDSLQTVVDSISRKYEDRYTSLDQLEIKIADGCKIVN